MPLLALTTIADQHGAKEKSSCCTHYEMKCQHMMHHYCNKEMAATRMCCNTKKHLHGAICQINGNNKNLWVNCLMNSQYYIADSSSSNNLVLGPILSPLSSQHTP